MSSLRTAHAAQPTAIPYVTQEVRTIRDPAVARMDIVEIQKRMQPSILLVHHIAGHLTNSEIATVAKDVSQDHVSGTKEVRHQMVSADENTTASSADHGHKGAAAAVVGGVGTPKLTVVLAVNPGHVLTVIQIQHHLRVKKPL